MSAPLRVSVFGSASAPDGEKLYEDARELGRLLGSAGCSVTTGGYGGTMAAVSRGASEAGAHVVGVTLAPWSRFELVANPWVKEELARPTLIARLERLVDADAFIALHGGLGTLGEVTLVWQLAQAMEIPASPLVLVGSRWRSLVDALREQQVLRPGDEALVTCVDGVSLGVDAVLAFDRPAAEAARRRVIAEMMRRGERG